MHDSPITKKVLLLTALFSSFVTGIIFSTQYFEKRTKIVFCDVGQGDGAYLRIQNKIDVIIDAGPPNNLMLICLGKHMPFWDKTIEYAIISHPQQDHIGGLQEILKHYKIEVLFSLPFSGISAPHFKTPRRGDSFSVLGTRITFLAPKPYRLRLPPGEMNDLSVVAEVRTPENRIIFTGDASSGVLNTLTLVPFSGKTILKIPHHGSRASISKKFLRLADPILTVISAGKNNPYGHPSPKVLELLKALHMPVRRTDREGDIVLRF